MANSEDQMSTLFEEGGIADEGMDTDPVSGNEVPPGSLPEEVRDDVPAMLSEGEYVVPADVLRFYGVKFFEDLRSEAKMGLAEMDSNGRIGGEPVGVAQDDLPFSDEELAVMDMPEAEPVAAAKGGLMGFQDGGLNVPAYIKEPDLSFLGGNASTASSGGLEYRSYVNDAGMTISIPFFDGAPMGMIPPGYLPEGEAPVQEEEEQDTPSRSDDDYGPDPEPIPEATPVSEMDDDQLSRAAKGLSLAGKIGSVVLGPLGGVALSTVTTSRFNDIRAELIDRGIETEESAQDYKGSIFGGQGDMYDNLTDTDGSGDVNFGDTWLGDLLGFDGAAGIKEGNAGLGASFKGARRGDDTGDSTGSVSDGDGPTIKKTAETKSNTQAADVRASEAKASGTAPTGRSTMGSDGAKKETYASKVQRGGGFSKGGSVDKKKSKKGLGSK